MQAYLYSYEKKTLCILFCFFVVCTDYTYYNHIVYMYITMINYMRERELFVRVRLCVGLYYTHARTHTHTHARRQYLLPFTFSLVQDKSSYTTCVGVFHRLCGREPRFTTRCIYNLCSS